MVKNNFGGNKAKGFARKNQTSKKGGELRTSQDELEIYAQVTKIYGGTMCQVITLDGTEMMCHIRGKFRGRGKRDNYIGNGIWMLVGLREWEDIENKKDNKSNKGKLLNCDVIEVYNDSDKNNLKNTVLTIDWSPFINNDSRILGSEEVEESEQGFKFTDDKTQEYQELIDAHIEATKSGLCDSIVTDDGEVIDVDDI
jgi:hypothetical protein